MTEWKRKRFWDEVSIGQTEDGFSILLDGRPVRTPGKALMALPTEALAEAVADEWRAQEGAVRPDTMPLTRRANSAIEKVAAAHEGVVGVVAAYGGSDLLCYRAAAPQELVTRQRAWDGPLDWAADRYGVRLRVTEGVMPVAQDAAALDRLAAEVRGHDAFALTGLHDLVSLTGSLVLGLAVAENHLEAAEAWALSRIDEAFQAEQWGGDSEAEAAGRRAQQTFMDAKTFLDLGRKPE